MPDDFLDASVAKLRLDPGRNVDVFRSGFRLFAFLKLDVHHSSLSSWAELIESLELLEQLLIDGDVDDVERSFAILSFRSPTFSTFGSVQDRSAENMVMTPTRMCSGAATYVW